MITTRWRLVLGLLPILGTLGCGAKGPEASASKAKTDEIKPVTVRVAPVERRRVERTIEVVGSLKGWDDVTVGSKRTGRVLKVNHDMGDRVKPGELIVELDTVDADLAVERAQRAIVADLAKVGLKELPSGKFDESVVPSVAQARFALEKARQNLTRERALRQRGAGTQQDFQNAEIDEQAADAALSNAILNVRSILDAARVSKVALDVARQQRIDMEVRAPIPSKPPLGLKAPTTYAVSKRSVSEGQMLKEGEAVVELVVENPLRLWTSVPERFSADLRLGQEVRLNVASYPGTNFLGKVTRINPAVDPVTRTLQVETAVPNDEGKLRPGGFAKASIVIRQDDSALTVPLESIIRFAGVTKLFIVQEDKTAKSIEVETGLEGKGWIEVIGPIPSQANVVVTGGVKLADKIPVIVESPPESSSSTKPTPVAEAPNIKG